GGRMNTQIYQEACDWFVDFRSGEVDAQERKRFAEWIRKSPEHLRAYLEITEIWQDAELVQTTDADSVEQLLAAASQERRNVVSLTGDAAMPQAAAHPRESSAPRRKPFTRRYVALAACVLSACALAASATYFFFQRNSYTTTTGEQRVLNL